MLPRREPVAAFEGSRRLAWVVVGAGFTGLASARRLAELHPQQEILVLEARCIAQGASGRNSGFAVATSQFPGGVVEAQLPNYRRVNRINRAGLDLLGSQVEAHAIDCDWSRNGIYHSAADRQALRECEHFRDYLERLEIEHSSLDQGEMARRLGTDLYRAGVQVADGALMQPAALVRGLAASLPANVTLCEQSPLLEIIAGHPLRLRLEAGEITTDKLILATNYEAPRLGFLRGYIIGSTLSGSFTRVLEQAERDSLGSETEWGAISLHGGGATLRLTADHRICLRNTAEYRGASLLPDEKLCLRRSIHRAAFEKRFPQLAHVPFEYSWSGVEGISRNGTNFFGRQRDNIYLAGGYNGSGISRGSAFGTAIADYASGESSQLVNDCLASAPASWIPPRPLLDIGAFFTVRSRFNGVGLDR